MRHGRIADDLDPVSEFHTLDEFWQLVVAVALDRGYTVQTPGQLPTYVTPNPGGAYTFQTPGQLPAYATPNINGGYTLRQPGRPPTYMRPQ